MEQTGPAVSARSRDNVRVRARRPAISLYDDRATPLDAVALNELAGLVGLASFLCYSKWGEFRSFLAVPRTVYAYFVSCGTFSALALFGLFAALERGEVVVVDPLSSPTSLFAIAVTVLFFRRVESITRRLIVGAVSVITGVVLITGPQVLVL